MTYDQKVGRFCIKSGPFTSRKQATNSLKLKQCDHLNKQASKYSTNYYLKDKVDKKLRFSDAFQFIVNIIPQNLIKVRKYLHAFYRVFIKIILFHHIIQRT